MRQCAAYSARGDHEGMVEDQNVSMQHFCGGEELLGSADGAAIVRVKVTKKCERAWNSSQLRRLLRSRAGSRCRTWFSVAMAAVGMWAPRITRKEGNVLCNQLVLPRYALRLAQEAVSVRVCERASVQYVHTMTIAKR